MDWWFNDDFWNDKKVSIGDCTSGCAGLVRPRAEPPEGVQHRAFPPEWLGDQVCTDGEKGVLSLDETLGSTQSFNTLSTSGRDVLSAYG